MKIPKWLWIKKYFDTGLGLTSYVKYLIAIFGFYSFIAKINPKWLIVVGVVYLFSCIFIGYWWIKAKMAEKEAEIGNMLNPFAVEMRDSIRKKRFK